MALTLLLRAGLYGNVYIKKVNYSNSGVAVFTRTRQAQMFRQKKSVVDKDMQWLTQVSSWWGRGTTGNGGRGGKRYFASSPTSVDFGWGHVSQLFILNIKIITR